MLLVSIHDVTPALESNVRQLWDMCAARDIAPALLVVPNWHGEWPLEQYPGFVLWISERVEQGAELVLHGERHDESGLPRRVSDHWTAWGNTAGEGEFLTLDEPAARERIERGVRLLRRVGLEPKGFVPPAWLAHEATHRAAASAGLGFSEDARSIRLLPSFERVTSPALRWSSRTSLRAWGSAAVAAARWRLQRSCPYPRLALHPQDLNHRATRRSLEWALQHWAERHRPGRYADLSGAPQRA
jgi:uncharacterized protein